MCALELTNSHLSDDSDLLAKAHKGLIVKKGGRFIEILFLTNLGFFLQIAGKVCFFVWDNSSKPWYWISLVGAFM